MTKEAPESAESEAKMEKSVGRFPRWVERHEKTIAAMSGVATAIGVLFAAASSFFAWQQLEIINRERATPYRVIIFNSKVASYQAISSEMSNFEALLYPHMIELFGKETNGRPYQPANHPLVIQQRKFSGTINQNIIFWSKNTKNALSKIQIISQRMMACFRLESTDRAIPIASPSCDFKKLEPLYKEWHDAREVAEAGMTSEIAAAMEQP